MKEIIGRILPQTWNDVLALLLILVIPILWIRFNLSGEVNGALIATWTLVIQYYFRRAPPNGGVK